MNSHVQRFYRKTGERGVSERLFHDVIALQDGSHLCWEDAVQKSPSLPRGWYELSQLNSTDRIEFTRDFWLTALPFFPGADAFEQFFDRLDDVGIFLIQPHMDSPFECEMAYSLKDESSFYRGLPPFATGEEVERLKVDFNQILPDDYLAFLKIHNGFSRHRDIGIFPTHRLDAVRKILAEELELAMDPMGLIPFYQAAGKPCYQCFFVEWAPFGQVGNVCCSTEKMISDVQDQNSWEENLAFPTFMDWLIDYLKRGE